MLHLDVKLKKRDITNAGINLQDQVLHNCQRHWIAEAIRYSHRCAVDALFNDTGDSNTIAK